MKKKYYQLFNQDLWKGRTDSDRPERWHQVVQGYDLGNPHPLEGASVLLGFASDEGVRLNKGRTGAQEGPRLLRKALAPVAFHRSAPPYDAGDVLCPEEKLPKAQRQLGKGVQVILEQGGRPMVLGGGHETAFGTYRGIRAWAGQESVIGVVNLDAHFDLRTYEQGANSGTSFMQMLDDVPGKAAYLVLGLEEAANSPTLFETAQRHHVQWVSQDVLHQPTGWEQALEQVKALEKRVDILYLSIDLDVFGAAYAPGVSAINPLGCSPDRLVPIIDYLAQHPKLAAVDICELNPTYDRDQQTAKLAARLVNRF
jgi:formiminoglutamase